MSDTQTVISDAMAVAGGGGSGTTLADAVTAAISPLAPGFSDNLSTLALQLAQLSPLTQTQATAVAENTQAVAQNTVAQKSGGAASVAGDIAKTAAKTLGGGLSLSPLVSAIAGVFSGSKQEALPTLPSYTAPSAVQFQGATGQQTGQAIVAADYGQDGNPRPVPATTPFYASPITVQVQALDSQSFMDHSDDIARAVREAILNSHSLNDAVSEL
jgi:hypothetical protein